MVPEGAGAEKFAEEGHHDEHQPITETVHQPVHERGQRLVRQRKSLQTTHDDAVGDDQSDKNGEHLTHIVEVRLQKQINQNDEKGDHQQLHDNADARWYCIADQRDDEV